MVLFGKATSAKETAAKHAGIAQHTSAPWINHAWHCTLYVTSRGLTTSFVPHGKRLFQIDFDFVDHVLLTPRARGSRDVWRAATYGSTARRGGFPTEAHPRVRH